MSVKSKAGKAAPRALGDSVRKVAYFAARIPNRTGAGARILGPLAEAGVNMLAFTGFPCEGGAQVDFVPERPAAFRAAARKLGIKVRPQKQGFLVQGADRKGAVAQLLGALADARINVTAIDAVSAGGGRYAAIFWVKPKDVAKTARLLKAR